MPGLGPCQQVLWATHKLGSARTFIDHPKLGCTVHYVTHPCHLLAWSQRECVLLISQGCQVSPCSAQAAHGRWIRTTSGCCGGSSELQCGNPCEHGPFVITVHVSTGHCHRDFVNFLSVHLSTAEQGNVSVKVSGARGAARRSNFSLSFKSAVRKT